MKLHTFCNDNLRHRLVALQSNTALCDFTFKLHDSTQFSTHKAVVAAFSTTALMLCDETGQVVIPRHDITRDIFQIVLNFIYGQSIVVKDTYMKQLEWLANYLGIEDLSKVLVPFKSLTSNSDVCIEIKEEPIELNDELDVQESTSAMLHNAVFSDTYADDNDIKDEDNEHSAILTKQRQKRHKTPKGKAKTKSSKKRKTDDTSKTKSDNANKELADDKNDDTDIDNEDDINDEMDTGESASNEFTDNLENVTTKQEPADSEQVAEPSTSANADQVEDDTKQHMAYKCQFCGANFATNFNKKRHIRSRHLGDNPFTCHHCEKTFKRKDSFIDHVKKRHTSNDETEKFICSKCEKQFICKRALRRHELIHMDTKYYCDICQREGLQLEVPRWYKTKRYLSQHKRLTHRYTCTSFVCPNCGKVFKRNKSLNYHIKHKHPG